MTREDRITVALIAASLLLAAVAAGVLFFVK